MKQFSNNQRLYSASDLVAFLECPHTLYLSLKNLHEEIYQDKPSALSRMLHRKGLQHEADYLHSLKNQYASVVEIPTEISLHERSQATLAAMRSQADVIYQGVLCSASWSGNADFLIKCKQTTRSGNHSYEVLDTKLSNIVRPKHLIQLCAYSELIEAVCGTLPTNMYLLLGNKNKESFKLNDFYFYYSRVKESFEYYVKHSAEIDSQPQLCRYCEVCKWQTHCKTQWRQNGHLDLIANIQRRHIDTLCDNGISTINELIAASPHTTIPNMSPNIFIRLRAQARLQHHKAITGEGQYEILQPQANKGFARMPLPNRADLFFDIEGDPFYPETLSYLFGIYSFAGGKETFKTFWAHDHAQEKRCCKSLIDFLVPYLSQHPDAHIYHYGHHETASLRRIASRYNVAEKLLEQLIQTHKFVDLYAVVHENLYISEPNYSLKSLESFYMERRTDTITQALDSITVYHEWQETQNETLLKQLADYNKADCRSTYLLRDWLLGIRPKDIPWFEKKAAAIQRADWEIEHECYTSRLAKQPQKTPDIYRRLSHLLEFHRRESRSKQQQREHSENSLDYDPHNDPNCLNELQLLRKAQSKDYDLIYTYRFPPQRCAIRAGYKAVDIETMNCVGTIEQLDNKQCIVKIKTHNNAQPLPTQLSISASNTIDNSIIRSAIYRYASTLINHPQVAHVATELLMNNPPRTHSKALRCDRVAADDSPETIAETISALDHSYFLIQGPPGSGKTHICARIIVDLIQRGKKIGISSNSHHAIHHLLREIETVATQKNISFRGVKKAVSGNDKSVFNGRFIHSTARSAEIDLSAQLFAGTAWMFSSSYFDKQLDYLFIDEAGQVATANVIAISNATKNIILVGDHMQLNQPMQSTHPPESNLSILELLLGKHSIIPTHRGLFLRYSHRLKPSLCRFISDAFYEGRLLSHDNARAGKLRLCGTELPNEGIAMVVSEHDNCSNYSAEEAEIIEHLYRTLLGQTFIDRDNSTRRIGKDDILILTPYNLQVECLHERLPEGARIDTVDKFQGQEAPIVLISMVTSSTHYLSQRIVAFLYNKNRLNVALSRAQCLAVVVASSKLREVTCTTVENMKFVNTYCWLCQYAEKLSYNKSNARLEKNYASE